MDVPVWLNNVAITGEAATVPFDTMLKSYLEAYHIRVTSDLPTASYWILINHMDYRQQIVSIGASTNPRQYQLILTIDFMLQDRKGRVISPPRQVVATRQLTINNDRILGSNAEEDEFIREMRQDAIVQILNILCKSNPRP